MFSRSKNSGNSVFLMLCAMGLFAILSSTMSKSPVLKPFANSLETPTDWIGIVASVSTIPGILISLPAASLSDILGRRKFLFMAGFVFASAPFLYILVVAWWQLMLVRFYHGFATAIFVPVAEATVAELFPFKRGERISLFSSATYIGRVIAPTLGGYILFVTTDNFRTLYLAVGTAGVAALIMSIPFLVRRKERLIGLQGSSKQTASQMVHGWTTAARKPEFLAVGIIQACQYYAYGATEFFLAGYLPEAVHLDKFSTGIILTSIIGMAIFARPYMGKVSDRIGRRTPIALGSVISAGALIAIPFVSDVWLIFRLALTYGFGFATVTAATPALISELVPNELVGTSMGFLDTIMDVGQTLGPIVSGFILSTSLQYAGVFPSLGCILLFSILVLAVSPVGKHDQS